MYDFLYEAGGLEKLMAIHAGYLKEMGYEVKIFFGDVNKSILDKGLYKGFEVRDFGIGKKNWIGKVIMNLLGFNKLKELIEKDDVILSYSFPINFAVRKLRNKKIFYLNHFPNYLYLPFKEKIIWANSFLRKIALISSVFFGRFLRKIDKKLVEKTNLLFVNSNFTKRRIDKIYKAKGIIVYPSVSNYFKPIISKEIKREYEIKDKYVYCSGRIIPDKKFDWLIKAFSYVEDKKIELVISGSIKKEYKEYLERIARNFEIKDRIKFLGLVPEKDLIRLYSNAEVYAFPAPKEDFGLCPPEAISCGTPCVVWGDGSGPNETITDGLNGYFAKPYELKDFARKIDLVLERNLKSKNRKKILKSSRKFKKEGIFSIFKVNIDKIMA